jgi:hypothetical protein
VADGLPKRIDRRINKAGLPRGGSHPFQPKLEKNHKGSPIIKKAFVRHGPDKGEVGYVATNARIWIKNRAHAGDPDHWDLQADGGKSYFRVDLQGNLIP